MRLRTLVYDHLRGCDVMTDLGTLDFDPTAHLSKEAAAKALHAALAKYANDNGYDPKNVLLWAPDVAQSSMTQYAAWTVCWEEGPFEWALNLSGEMHSGAWGYTEPYNSFILTFTS